MDKRLKKFIKIYLEIKGVDIISYKIGLHDASKDFIRNKDYPNYAIMKISAWHKLQGDDVEWWNPLLPYDKVYSSKIFDYLSDNPYLPHDTIKGGTGYNITSRLPVDIDNMYPDYNIYPNCDYAIGFLTRGCPNNCNWCVVPEKEGNIKPYRRWENLVRSDTNKLVLMDNNILACDYGIKQLESMIGSDIKIDLNQGMDARLVTDEIAEILSRLRFIKYIRFSCDQESQIESVVNTYNLLKKYGVSLYKIFIYLLVRKDLEDADYRVQQLNKLKGISIYAQAERNSLLGIVPNKLQLEFSQRYVYGRLYKKETWIDYCKRKNIRMIA